MLSAVRIAARQPRHAALFSSSALCRSEGAPSGKGQDSFNKREKAQEENYVRQHEQEKLAALRKSIQASKEHLAELEKQHSELEKGGKQ
ncbi:hypothetical protein JCM10207_002619 [Rhodosporidiobolus poonsookiae]